MHPSNAPHLLKYNITPKDEGVLLRIWEAAPKNEVRVRPFLFMIRYYLPSEDKAKELLEVYLSLYRTKATTSEV